MLNKALFTSNSGEWETPQEFYAQLNAEFNFTCDVAANGENYKHPNYFDKATNGLVQPWRGVCWCNPPYGRDIGLWVQKAHNEAQNGVVTVMLIPARTDARYFHDFVYERYEVRFIRGRLKFGKSKNSAPFPSMIIVFTPSASKKIPVGY